MNSGLKLLIDKGRRQGFLTRAEILEILPKAITDEEQINDILIMINDMGIAVADDREPYSGEH